MCYFCHELSKIAEEENKKTETKSHLIVLFNWALIQTRFCLNNADWSGAQLL